jgi:hypothetical protein
MQRATKGTLALKKPHVDGTMFLSETRRPSKHVNGKNGAGCSAFDRFRWRDGIGQLCADFAGPPKIIQASMITA